MPTLKERILDLLQNGDGLTDREITDRLFAPGALQQPVNQTCRQLESQGRLSRKSRPDGKIGNYLTGVVEIPQQTEDVASSSDFLSEDAVKLHLKNWLESQGWRTTVVWRKERGIDIEASRNNQRWIIEAKGSGSRDQMRVNYFISILGETLQRMNDPAAKYSIALPDHRQFRNLWTRLPELAKSRTTITMLFVDLNGNVEEINHTAAGSAHAANKTLPPTSGASPSAVRKLSRGRALSRSTQRQRSASTKEHSMKQPQIEIITIRGAVRSDVPVTLDVLLRITPPAPEVQVQRPALNLGLVLDRSGSMGVQNKIGFAREAAIYTVQQIFPTDRVSVTIFDDKVETIVPSTLGDNNNKGRIVELIQRVEPGGSTALHGGWQEGAKQVRQHLLAAGLNRVFLLSDGLANVGETNPDAIASEVDRLAKEGVSTTTMGVGDDYNEDLMEAMARSGDGNYYYIESPQQLEDMFQSELKGLMATFGNMVSLGVEPQDGVVLADVLNDLDRLPTGRLKLPSLIAGMPIIVVVRLNIPAAREERELCRFRLAWNVPKQPERSKMRASLCLPPVDAATWESLAPALEVRERVALLLMARYKKQATSCLEREDRDGAVRVLQEAKQLLASAPDTPEMRREAQALAEIGEYLTSGTWVKFLKHAKYQAHQRRRSEPYRNP